MWGKGVARGRKVEAPKSVLDLAPTICYLLGLEPPKGSVGRTLTEGLER
jgi:arylsulfatase A-like enzyme